MDEDLENFKINLGKRIKALREERDLTQPELGALIDKDYQVLGRIENGRVNPSSFLVYRIARALKVRMDEVFDFRSQGNDANVSEMENGLPKPNKNT